MSLLPSKPEASPPDDAEPRVVGVDSEDAEEVLSALSSETARKLLAEIHEDPAAPSELADRVDTSLQNAQYHLEKLESAGAVAVVDTAYSAKGREMDVYAPADQPLVIFAGDDDDSSLLRSALSRVLGAVGVLGLASLAIQQLYGERGLFGGGDGGEPLAGGGEGAAAGGANVSTETASPSPAPADTPTAGGDGQVGAFDVTTDAGTPTDEPMRTATETAIETMTETAASATETVSNATQTATEAADAAPDVAAGLPPGLLFFAGGLFALVVVGAVLAVR
ncbi:MULTISPECIES: ArsR/SmtB family transcription factor [Salinibaculum]|uniref:ArsR/SmtB family transcription factor n=1 Tax=Salinibaculum TaxID=2732368 RepID=UPI0030CB8A06